MGQIMLKTQTNSATLVSNIFIDEYMNEANEAQIKIYLYLLRCMGDNIPVSMTSIADKFNYIEKDILRSLIYLDRKGLLSVDYDENNNVVGICVNDCTNTKEQNIPNDRRSSAVSVGPVSAETEKVSSDKTEKTTGNTPSRFYTQDQMKAFKGREDIQQLIFITEHYLSKQLTLTDLNTLLYIYDSLHFPVDLMEYLVECCANSGNKNMAYIEKVAIAWAEKNILTVEEARLSGNSSPYRKEGFAVLREYGITSRSLTSSDLGYVTRWIEEYKLDLDVILEGCRRTITAISRPSYQYTDSILKRWSDAGVHSISDVSNADKAFSSGKGKTTTKPPVKNQDKFHNFNGRDTDYDSIAKQIMEQQD